MGYEIITVETNFDGRGTSLINYYSSFQNTLQLQDQISVQLVNLQFQEQLTDAFLLSDSFTFQVGGAALGVLLPVENLLLLDSSVALLEELLEDEFGDNILFTESAQVFLSCVLTLTDVISFLDFIQILAASSQFSDAYTLSDRVSISLASPTALKLSDQLSLVDSVHTNLAESFQDYLRRYLNDK